MENTYKYFAFISYNSKDTEWGKQLQKKLERYKLPATLCSEHGWERRPIKPVFFAPTDIQPGGLTEELQDRLRAAKNLIVICSPNSAKSQWVGMEIEFFHSLGRTQNIHFFIVDGTPNSGNPDTECFNPVVKKLGLPEILGANIHEKIYRWPWLNKERAYVQLISKLLGIEFDAIWQRHRRQLIRRTVAWSAGSIAIVASLIGVWSANQPFNAELRLNEASVHNDALPPLKGAVVTMRLDNELKSDTILSLEDNVVFTNIPHRYLNHDVQFTVTCPDFLDTDTTLLLTPNVTLNIRRDEAVYGAVSFRIWDWREEMPLSDVQMSLAGQDIVSDATGRVTLFVPLQGQSTFYCVECPVPLENDTVFLPCGKDDILRTR